LIENERRDDHPRLEAHMKGASPRRRRRRPRDLSSHAHGGGISRQDMMRRNALSCGRGMRALAPLKECVRGSAMTGSGLGVSLSSLGR